MVSDTTNPIGFSELDAFVTEVRQVPEGRNRLRVGDLMVYPSGRAVDDAIRAIPVGSTVTSSQLRQTIAAKFNADVTCPVTFGKSLRVVVEMVSREIQAGAPIESVTPIWRAIGDGASVVKRTGFDSTLLTQMRETEAPTRDVDLSDT